jgi:hypothetical protein
MLRALPNCSLAALCWSATAAAQPSASSPFPEPSFDDPPLDARPPRFEDEIPPDVSAGLRQVLIDLHRRFPDPNDVIREQTRLTQSLERLQRGEVAAVPNAEELEGVSPSYEPPFADEAVSYVRS